MAPNFVIRGEPEIPTAAKVAFLSRPAAYPEHPRQVYALETHMSWVFLTDAHAYKLKKPVRRDFLDFSTLELRRRDCEAEVVLNRPLAPGVYLETIPLAIGPSAELCLGGDGPVADWLVKMRRLPAERFLDRVILSCSVPETETRAAAARLAGFYRQAIAVPMAATEYRARLRNRIEDNRRELLRPECALPERQLNHVAGAQQRFLDVHAALVGDRAASGRIIEAHGDLRPEHVCLVPEPVIIDRLEFSRDLRILDPVDELALLAMECERLGSAPVGALFFEVHGQIGADRPSPALVDFYKSCWACFRCKIGVWHVLDPEVRDKEKWSAAARDYLDRAQRYVAAID
ncbi:MAG: hypothetical protein M0Z84_09840 [Gammaproteobacteria bacterium]|nr:hypothetical protein [Gammaproteobacteria bacterium]